MALPFSSFGTQRLYPVVWVFGRFPLPCGSPSGPGMAGAQGTVHGNEDGAGRGRDEEEEGGARKGASR